MLLLALFQEGHCCGGTRHIIIPKVIVKSTRGLFGPILRHMTDVQTSVGKIDYGATACLRCNTEYVLRETGIKTNLVPRDVDMWRMNTGILLGNTTDLTVACGETIARKRATARDMFTAAASSLV